MRGGNQQIVDELARRVAPQIRPLHRLEAIRSKGQGFTLTFQTDGKVVDEDADVVVLTVPFSILRDVKMQVELPPLKTQAIRELGTAPTRRCWSDSAAGRGRNSGTPGATYTDEMFQLAWANSLLQPGAAGGLTLYSGGKLAHDVGQGTAEEVAARLMRGVERAYPGATARAQRQGLADALADVPVDEGQLFLLQTRAVDDDRRLRRAAGRQSVLRRRTLQLRFSGLHERRGAIGRRHGEGRHVGGERREGGGSTAVAQGVHADCVASVQMTAIEKETVCG